MHKLAVIADPHYHEIFPGYGIEGVVVEGQPGACLRSRADSAASTRIFNESYLALPAVLDACVAEGIHTVLIAGDLTDDGQLATMQAALALLDRYERQHGMRFFLTPGNHDVYGMSGRHHAKDFLSADGTTITVASDPAHRGAPGRTVVHDPRMVCNGYGALVPLWGRHGLMRRPEDIHWESPFGQDEAPEARMFEMRSPDGQTVHRQIDASYLVEPEPGLWILSIDANVFEPRNGRRDNTDPSAFKDSTNAGWNAMLRLKPFILDWMADVAERARREGKTLVCFSHYPAIDPYDDTLESEVLLFGQTQAIKRIPHAATAQAVCATGIGTHFSGHLHVNDTQTLVHAGKSLTNIALPSPVAFPPAYCLVTAQLGTIAADMRTLSFAGFDRFFPYYRVEARRTGQDTQWLEASTYPEFLHGHVSELVRHRYLPREWPPELAAFLDGRSVDDLFALARIEAPIGPEAADRLLPRSKTGGISAMDLVVDWYLARKGSALALDYIAPHRLETYNELMGAFAWRRWDDPQSLQASFALVMSMMGRYLQPDEPVLEAAQ